MMVTGLSLMYILTVTDTRFFTLSHAYENYRYHKYYRYMHMTTTGTTDTYM